MDKMLRVVCVSLIVTGCLVGSASAYTVQAKYYIDGVDIDLGAVHANPAVLLILVGSPDKIEQLLKPPAWTLNYFDDEVDFYFGCEYNPALDQFIIAVRNDADPEGANIVGIGVNPTTLADFAEVDAWLEQVIQPDDRVVLRTAADDYFQLGNFQFDLDAFTITFDVDEISGIGEVIPEPSTLLLLGLGLLGLIGIRWWKRKGRGFLKLLLLLVLAGGLLLSNVAPVAAQTFDCSPPNQTQIPQIECEALVALYNSTAGPTWKNTQNNDQPWLATNTPCSWFKVTCDSNHVVKLEFWMNQLTGSIPPELTNLTKLQYLNLQYNNLSGNIPPELGNLTNLTHLRLANNQLSGTIPPELGNLTNLDYLSLHVKYLTKSFRVLIVLSFTNVMCELIRLICVDDCVHVFPLSMLQESPSVEPL